MPFDVISYSLAKRKAERFKQLRDTPDSYAGCASKFVVVKADETGLTFGDAMIRKDEGTPEIVSSIQLVTSGIAGRCYGVDIYGRYAYVASHSEGKLYVVDIKNPEDLAKIGEVQAPTSPSPECRWPVAVGRYVFTDGYDTAGNSAIHVIDVSDPSTPEIVAYAPIQVPGRRIVRDKIMYGCAGSSLLLIDISDPYSLELLSSINPYGEEVKGVDVRGKIAVVCGFHRVATIDVSDPYNPSVIGTLTDNTNLSDDLRDVKIIGKYAIIADLGGDAVVVIDISDLSAPTFVSKMSAAELDGCRALEATDRYVYACAGSGDRFTIVNIEDPTKPSIAASIYDGTLLDGAMSCKLYGNYAIVVTSLSGYIVSVKLGGYAIPHIRTQGLSANRIISEYVNVDRHINAMSGTYHKLYSNKFYPKVVSSDTEPNLTDGELAIWHDTAYDERHIIVRHKGLQTVLPGGIVRQRLSISAGESFAVKSNECMTVVLPPGKKFSVDGSLKIDGSFILFSL